MAFEMNLPLPKAVIFDWDDTVVDNWPLSVEAFNAMMRHMGHDEWDAETQLRRRGASAKDLLSELFGSRWEDASKFFYDYFVPRSQESFRLHDNIEDLLQSLSDAGVYLAIVSNKRGPALRQDVERSGFGKYFSAIVGAGDAAADKPDPAPVLKALEGSGIAPGPDVWFLGDSHIDMICAINSGCTPVLIETKVPPEDLLTANPPRQRFKKHLHIVEWLKKHASP